MQKSLFPVNCQKNICGLLILSISLILLAYSNSFQTGWQLDDIPNILGNQKQQITELTGKEIWDAMTANPGDYSNTTFNLTRPVARLSLGLNWFFGGNNVIGYHIVNVLIHLGTSSFLFLLIITLFQTPVLKTKGYSSFQIIFIATCATLFWALNPIQVQAVTYIVQRMASMAAFFSLFTLLLYLKARLLPFGTLRPFLLVASAISFILAFFSKENALLTVLFIPVFEFLFFQTEITKKSIQKYVLLGGILIILGIAITLLLSPTFFSRIIDPDYFAVRPYTLWQRLLTEQRIIVYYLSLLFFPDPERLSIHHDIFVSTSIFSPVTTISAISFNVILFFSAIYFSRRQPLFALAIIFFYINHIIESSIVPLELIFEHRNYLPSVFLFVPLAQLMCVIMHKIRNNILLTIIFFLMTGLLFSTLSLATFSRNKVWKTKESLWLDAATKAPESQRPYSSLALFYGWGPNYTGGEEKPTEKKYTLALEMQKKGLGKLSDRVGLKSDMLGNIAALYVKLHNYPKALDTYKQAIGLAPNNLTLQYHLAKLLLWTGDFNQAEQKIIHVLQADFQHVNCWNLLALINLWTDNPNKALPVLQYSLKSSKRYDTFLYLGKSFALMGQHDKARIFYGQALSLSENNATLALAQIENALLANDIKNAEFILYRAIKTITLPQFVKPLILNKEGMLHNTIPLNRNLLLTFLSNKFANIDIVLQDIDDAGITHSLDDEDENF
jgi:tetratricopeptide (TPR) repeat protein